jgi:hypothetical protein
MAEYIAGHLGLQQYLLRAATESVVPVIFPLIQRIKEVS